MNQVYDYWSRRKLAESVSMSHTMVNQFVRAGKISVEEFGLPVPAALRELAKVLQGNDKMISARERALMLSEDMERRLDGQSAPEELSVEDIVERCLCSWISGSTTCSRSWQPVETFPRLSRFWAIIISRCMRLSGRI